MEKTKKEQYQLYLRRMRAAKYKASKNLILKRPVIPMKYREFVRVLKRGDKK
jgi:hypothetical protein